MHAAGTLRLGGARRLVYLAITLVAMPVFALRPPEGGGDQPHSGSPPALPAQPRDSGQLPAASNASPQTPKSVAPSTAGDSFTPSERIKADSAVSFPVDI